MSDHYVEVDELFATEAACWRWCDFTVDTLEAEIVAAGGPQLSAYRQKHLTNRLFKLLRPLIHEAHTVTR